MTAREIADLADAILDMAEADRGLVRSKLESLIADHCDLSAMRSHEAAYRPDYDTFAPRKPNTAKRHAIFDPEFADLCDNN